MDLGTDHVHEVEHGRGLHGSLPSELDMHAKRNTEVRGREGGWPWGEDVGGNVQGRQKGGPARSDDTGVALLTAILPPSSWATRTTRCTPARSGGRTPLRLANAMSRSRLREREATRENRRRRRVPEVRRARKDWSGTCVGSAICSLFPTLRTRATRTAAQRTIDPPLRTNDLPLRTIDQLPPTIDTTNSHYGIAIEHICHDRDRVHLTRARTPTISSSPIYTSPYPPLPPIPSVNAHDLLLGRSEQDGWEDFALYVEPGSGGAGGDVTSGAEAGSGTANERGTKQGRANEQDSSANTLTFTAFRQRVAVAATVLARQLGEMGLDVRAEPGPIVGFLSENSVTFATAAHALLRLAIPFAHPPT